MLKAQMIDIVFDAIQAANVERNLHHVQYADHPDYLRQQLGQKHTISVGEFAECVDILIRIGLVTPRMGGGKGCITILEANTTDCLY